MARKRGGLAGLWDRNKGAIGSVAGGLAASFIPGAGAFLAPAIGGIIGGSAARGRLDTRNLLGDAAGGIGGGGLKTLGAAFMPKASAQVGQVGGQTAGRQFAGLAGADLTPVGMTASSMPQVAGNLADPLLNVANANFAATAPSFAQRAGRAVGNVGSYLARNPEVGAATANALGGAVQGAANRDIQRDALAQREREFALREREYEDEMERRRRIAEYLRQQLPMMTPEITPPWRMGQ